MKAKGSTSRWREYKPHSLDGAEYLRGIETLVNWFLKQIFQMDLSLIRRVHTSLDPSSKRRSGKFDARLEDRISRGEASRCSRFCSRPAAAHVQKYWQILKIIGLGLTFPLAWINEVFVSVWMWDQRTGPSSTCSTSSCWMQNKKFSLV